LALNPLAIQSLTGVWLGVLSLSVLGGGCGASPATFDELRVYVHEVFESRLACEDYNDANPDFWVNCEQVAEFGPDGRLGIMFTDIVGSGVYSIHGEAIRCRMEGPIDAPDAFVFEMVENGQEIVYENGEIWRLNPDATPFLID